MANGSWIRASGTALAVNYVYNWAVTIAVDLVAAQIVISYWFPDIPSWYWSALFLALLFFINSAKETPSFIS